MSSSASRQAAVTSALVSGDLAGHDLAAAQGDALPGIAVTDRMAQPCEHALFLVGKGQGPHPCRGIPHPHPGPPLACRGVPGRGQDGLQLFPAADIDDLHFRSLRRVQRSFHGVIVFRGGFSDADHPISQVQARRLGGVGGAAICPVHIGKAHDERPLGEHLDPKGRPADGYAGACCHHRADGLDGQPAAQGQRGLVAAHRAGADNILTPVQAQRLHPAKPGQHKGLLRFQVHAVRQAGVQPAQRGGQRRQQIHCCQLHPPSSSAPAVLLFHAFCPLLRFGGSMCKRNANYKQKEPLSRS